MKKLILLLTMICAADQLYGMENPQPNYMDMLPQEVQGLIVMALAQSSNDIDATIRTIKAMSVTNKALNQIVNNQKEFNALVHILTNKFNTVPEVIAKKFNTSTSLKYQELSNELVKAIKSNDKDKITQLIADGADVNSTQSRLKIWKLAMGKNEILPLLLRAGIQVNKNDIKALSAGVEMYPNKSGAEKWRISLKLLDETMQKE